MERHAKKVLRKWNEIMEFGLNDHKLNLIRDLEDIGVHSGDTLNVKASLRSIGEIQGGANTLIEALMEVVGEKGTIVTDLSSGLLRL